MSDAPPSVTAAPAPAARGGFSARAALACAILLTLAHLGWILAHFAPATMSPDANGYIVQGRLLATKGETAFAATSPVQFVGMHWLETEPGVFHSRYPAGLPALFALAWKIGGLRAALLVNPLLASGTVLLGFFLARRFVGAPFALLAAAVIATAPVANQHALDADAHIAATFFLVAGVLALLRFGDTRRIGVGLLAGVLLGVVPTIRYPEAIVSIAIAIWLLARVQPWWALWPPVVGAAIPVLALLAHNAAAYGAFWRTGYALTNEQTGFGLHYFAAHALPYLQALGGQGMGLFFAFGAAGLAALAGDRRWRAEGLLFAGIVTPLVLLYMAYYFGGGGGGMGGAGMGGNLRFLIPTYPFFAVAGAWLLAKLAEHAGRPGYAAAIVVAALQLVLGVGGSISVLAQTKNTLTAAARVQQMAQAEIPSGSVVIVDHSLAESLDAIGRWKLMEENFVGLGGAGMMGGPGGFGPGPGAIGGRPLGGRAGRENRLDLSAPSPQQRGKNQAQQERYAGLRGDERREHIWADVVKWANGKPVFWFARSTDAVERALPAGGDYRSIAEVDAPTVMGPGGGGGMGGPMAGGMMAGPGGRGSGGRGTPGGRGGFGPGRPFGFPGTQDFGPGRAGVSEDGSKLRLVRLELPKA